jgi:sirohydrochlorin ferrochelatase
VLGCREPILALSQRRYEEALAGRRPVAASRTLLIMVGRGSFDAEATTQMHRFSQLRAERTPVARVLTCFVAMQRPLLAETLQSIARADYARIVVQPHLLFSGQLLTDIQTTVERFQDEGHESKDELKREWIVAPHLGPAAELVAAVMDAAHSALRPSA